MNTRVFSTIALFAALAVTAGDLRPDKPEAGETWILNRQARVCLTIARDPTLTWQITGERWSTAAQGWVKTVSGVFVGDFTGPTAAACRERYHCYYPFQRVTEPGQPDLTVDQIATTVADGSAALTFRVGKQDLWCRARIRILQDTPLLFFESLGSSHPALLRPHWTLTLATEKPLLRLVADQPGQPAAPIEVEARNREGNLLHLAAQRYCAAYRPDADTFFVFAWLPDGEKKTASHGMLWPKNGGLGSVYLDAPFVFLTETSDCAKDLPTLAHQGENTRSWALGILLPK